MPASYPKTLADPAARRSIEQRLAALAPSARRRWGKMSAHPMLCHLTDSYRGVIGEKRVSMAWLPLPRRLIKFSMLYLPWPRNAPTRPEMKQGPGGGGTAPVDFESDRASLLAAMARFCAAPDSLRGPPPIAGKLSREEWLRWGYLHSDHHLRQFGA